MNNFSTRSPRDYYYNQERRWNLSDLEESDSDTEELINFRLKPITKYIIINSLDRNWTDLNNSETPYSFKIFFGLNASNNTNTFKIPYNLKNIVGLTVAKLFIHNKQRNIGYQSTVKSFINNNPYLIVDLDGFNDINDGTNKHLNSGSSIMSSLTPMPSSLANFKSLEFKNINLSKKDFSLNPLSTLSYLKINIKNQLGSTPTQNIQDVLEIDGIVKNGAGTSEYLYIQTKTYFSDEYQTSDIIKIKNYRKIDKDSGNIADTSSEAQQFNAFINREEGHQIIEITNTDGTPIHSNLIKILKPHTISLNDGTLTDETYFTNLTTIKTLDTGDTSVQEEPVNNGVLINVNLQTHLFLNIVEMKKENIVNSQLV